MTFFAMNAYSLANFRKQTERGFSSGGQTMTRKCCKCGCEASHFLFKKVKGTGGSRFNETKWECREGC